MTQSPKSPKSIRHSPLRYGRSPKWNYILNAPSRNVLGGKATFRHVSHEFDTQLTGVFRLVSTSSFYGYFYRFEMSKEQRAYATVNVDKSPSTFFVQHLGVKMVLISMESEQYWKYKHKQTTTAAEFRKEALMQYKVFKDTSLKGANALTPGVLSARIMSNEDALGYLAQYTGVLDENTWTSLYDLIKELRYDRSLKLGNITMDLIPGARTIRSEIDATGNQIRQDALTNWHRWSLLRTASASEVFHQDFHQQNALYSEEDGFHRDVDARGLYQPLNESIQIIDWGRTFQDAHLLQEVRNVMVEMGAYVTDPKYASWFTPDFVQSKQSADPTVVANFNHRIHRIFLKWLNLGNMTGPWYYLFVINRPFIDSHTIMYFEARYRRNRRLITKHTYENVITDDDELVKQLNSLAY